MREFWDRWDRVAERAPWLRRFLAVAGPALAILLLQVFFFPLQSQNGSSGALWGIYLLGIILGLLNALVAVGMALVYRSNRILNFAQGDLGSVPTVLAVNLIVFSSVPYFVGLLTGLVGAVVLGGLVEFLIIRRFFRASRLILTVATIGLSQLLAVCGLLIPRHLGQAADEPADQGAVHLRLHAEPDHLPRRERVGTDRGAARAGGCRALPALHLDRYGRPRQRRARRPGQPARYPREGPPDPGLGVGLAALVHRVVPAGGDRRSAGADPAQLRCTSLRAGRADARPAHQPTGHRTVGRRARRPRTGRGLEQPPQPRTRLPRGGGCRPRGPVRSAQEHRPSRRRRRIELAGRRRGAIDPTRATTAPGGARGRVGEWRDHLAVPRRPSAVAVLQHPPERHSKSGGRRRLLDHRAVDRRAHRLGGTSVARADGLRGRRRRRRRVGCGGVASRSRARAAVVRPLRRGRSHGRRRARAQVARPVPRGEHPCLRARGFVLPAQLQAFLLDPPRSVLALEDVRRAPARGRRSGHVLGMSRRVWRSPCSFSAAFATVEPGAFCWLSARTNGARCRSASA